MEIREEYVNRIIQCDWLARCGFIDQFDFDVKYLPDWMGVEKRIGTDEWADDCMDRRNDFTLYLFQNCGDLYDNYWNEEVMLIREKYTSFIVQKIDRYLSEKGLRHLISDVTADIEMNVISILMLEYFSEYFHSDFFDQMLKIYLAGHIPCGWEGSYSGGKFIIY